MSRILNAMIAMGLFGLCTPSFAQTSSQVFGDSITKQTQTVFIQGDAGYTTYDSEVADGQVTNTTTGVTVGSHAGEDRPFGIIAEHVSQDMSFDQSSTDITNSWTDVKLASRLFFFYPSVGISVAEMKVDQELRSVFTYGKGINAGLGMKAAFTRDMMIEAQAKFVRMLDNDNLSQTDTVESAKLLDRREADIHAAFDIIELYVDFLVGYRIRSFGIEIEDATGTERYQENQSSPYAGLRLGLYF